MCKTAGLARSSLLKVKTSGTICQQAGEQVQLILTGLSPISLLEWSPDGSYLLAATPENGFQLWETSRWTNVGFQAGNGQLMSACWSQGSKTILLAFASARQLTALYLIGTAYSLRAQLLPVDLPSFKSSTDTSASGKRSVLETGRARSGMNMYRIVEFAVDLVKENM